LAERAKLPGIRNRFKA